ncbi:MAG TPA: response regulator, partial [Anaeromyxobacteraceae bacterium]|nr:response regulator [Anaeromyxobacteraceae bacterium]
AARAPVPRGRVMVVDDERLVGSSLRRGLSSEHDVTVAASSRLALRLVEQGERFDAVVADLMMPDLTGVELRAELARLDPALARKVVFMTAGALTDEVQRVVEAGEVTCLLKPVPLDLLRDALARVMR